MNINFGDKNKINNSSIGHQFNSNNKVSDKKNFAERHPIIISFVISLVIGFIFLFSFWDKVINWIESSI